MRFFRAALAAVAAAVLLTTPSLAQTAPLGGLPFLSPLFTDNMVLQRGQSDPVWGWTTPGATVTVRVAGKGAKAVAGADGKWTAKLPPLPVGGPYTLAVTGPQSAALANVLVGDVWLCSGQSNMQFGIGNTKNAAQEIAAADYPQIRLFMAPTILALSPHPTMPVSDGDPAESRWHVCTPQTVALGGWNGFSAVGYFFGRDLYQNLRVPIGLIESNVGGTPAEAWTSEQALRAKMPDFRPQLAELDADRGQDSPFPQRLAAWYRQNDPGSASGLGWADPALDDSGWETMTLPGYFQQAGLADLAGVNGVVWFRRTFDLPAGAAGKDLTLHFLADDDDTAWVNGTPVGATDGYNTPRAYAVPAGVLKPTGNVIAVRVLDTGGGGGIWGDPGTLSLGVPGGPDVPLTGPWRVRLGSALTKMTAPPVDIKNDSGFPSVLYNGMISPLIPYGIKGALWYQGENNAGQAQQYRTLLPTLIGDWRGRWGEGPFPFLIVQLAGWQPGGVAWAELREAQWLTAQTVPNAWIATAIDIGDPTNIHPTDKQDVGLRLAQVAREQVYHEKIESYGPVYRSMTTAGGTVHLSFDHVGGGLTAQGGTLAGFTISSADMRFVPADARIVGNTVIVSSSAVPQPVAVRYDWDGNPPCTLYSLDGLPAFPFRTDGGAGHP